MHPFLNEITRFSKSLARKQLLCFLFNYDDIVAQNPRGKSTILERIVSISKVPCLCSGIISRNPLNELQKISGTEKIIIAGSSGFEIDSPDFSWTFPKLGLIRHQLENTFSTIQMKIGPSWAKENVIFDGVGLRIRTPQNDAVLFQRLSLILQHALQDTHLSIVQQTMFINIIPTDKWNKGQCFAKIFELLPRAHGLLPVISYFGAERNDEPAFKQVNLFGYSVLLRENIGRKTEAQYFLRNTNELNKLLLWLNSQ